MSKSSDISGKAPLSPQSEQCKSSLKSNSLVTTQSDDAKESFSTPKELEDCDGDVTRKEESPSLPEEKRAKEEQTNTSCMLLEDLSTDCIPLHLRKLLENFDIEKLTPAEILFLFVFVVALEAGFCAQQQYVICQDVLAKLAPTCTYNARNVLLLSGHKPTYTHDAQKSYFSMRLRTLVHLPPSKTTESLLTALVTGDYMIATLTPDNSIEMPGCSVCLSIGRYVLGYWSKDKPLHQRLRKLNELTLQLRDVLFIPIRNRQFALLQLQVYPSLAGLPAELYDNIFKYLTRNQLKIMANVSRELHNFCTNSKYFKNVKKQNII